MTPVRLEKKSDKKRFSDKINSSYQFDKGNFFCNNDLKTKVEAWCIRHASACMLISIITFLLLFVALCSALCGASATESGTMYNQFLNII